MQKEEKNKLLPLLKKVPANRNVSGQERQSLQRNSIPITINGKPVMSKQLVTA